MATHEPFRTTMARQEMLDYLESFEQDDDSEELYDCIDNVWNWIWDNVKSRDKDDNQD